MTHASSLNRGAYLHPSAWTASQMRCTDTWIVRLDDQDNNELRSALSHAKTRGSRIPQLTESDFPLPRLSARMKGLRDEIINGRGFALVRGLFIDDLSAADAALIYWGVGAHMGRGCAQNAQGDMLGHVTDIGQDFRSNPNARGYQSRHLLPFHNDIQDIVGLMCLAPARSGGESRIVSTTAIHNLIIERHPELIDTMYAPFPMDRRGEAAPGRDPWLFGPLFEHAGGRLFCRYNRTYIESSMRFEALPRLTEKQRAVLDRVDALCEDPEMSLGMELLKGDMQFLCNYTVLHSRTAYIDWPETERRRYLLRLWLDTGKVQPLPVSWQERYADTRAWAQNPQPPIFDLSARRNDLVH